MSEKDFMATSEKLARYAADVFQPEDDVLRRIRELSKARGLPPIQVGPMDGLHLEILTRAAGTVRAVEIGTLGGYSGVCIARGLGPGGKLYTLEIDEKHADVAAEAFRLAGVSDRTEIRVGPAVQSLQALSAEGPFDLIFIDADKANYPTYLDWAADHLRLGGLVLGDNTFGFGLIADETLDPEDRKAVEALRDFNRKSASEGRFRSTILPTGEGLTVGVRIR